VVANHVVQGRVVFPGAGYLEVARAAIAAAAVSDAAMGEALSSVFFLQPLLVEVPGLHVECAIADGRFEISSAALAQSAAVSEDPAVHCSGSMASFAASRNSSFRCESARCNRGVRAADVGALYDGYFAVGVQYGPGYRTLTQAWSGDNAAAARLQTRWTWYGTDVHPADLDDALCVGALAARGRYSRDAPVPFAVDDARLQSARGELWAVR
jgi:hypothetical protein